jgi:predicted DNA-binding protein with PD1-like motif
MMKYRPVRLAPGADLRRALEALCTGSSPVSAFVVAGIGSLTNPRIRYAGVDAETVLEGAFEILSLCGTLTADGTHLHMALSDGQGRVVGGHVCYGNEIRTTAEILLALTTGWRLSREFDASTGYRELSVRGVEDGANEH